MFHIANDNKLDANTASEYELRTVEMMKEKTAREIYNKRLYDDEGDLYSKVSMNDETHVLRGSKAPGSYNKENKNVNLTFFLTKSSEDSKLTAPRLRDPTKNV